MKKIRVLQLGSPTGLYGAERWILALIKHLDPEKVESAVAVVKDAPDLDAPLCREAERLGFPSHCIEAYGKVNFSAARRLRELIQKGDIDILHSHGYKTDLIGLLATRGTQCKIISTPHGWSRGGGFKLWCYEMMDRRIFPFLDGVVPLSEGLCDELRRIPGLGRKLSLILNGVDISEIDAADGVACELLEWKAEGALIIGYIGRLIPSKALDVLLNAVARLDSINWRVAVVGDGEQGEELEQLSLKLKIDDRVKFFGFQEERLSFLKGFDVFVLPSRTEGTPRCLMEAMAAGVPVVASDIKGCRVLIENEQTGLLFPVDAWEMLADRIETIASDEKIRDSLARKGRELINRQFSAERMAGEYAQLYATMGELGPKK